MLFGRLWIGREELEEADDLLVREWFHLSSKSDKQRPSDTSDDAVESQCIHTVEFEAVYDQKLCIGRHTEVMMCNS